MDRSRTEDQPIVRDYIAQLESRRGSSTEREARRELIDTLRSRESAEPNRLVESGVPGVRVIRFDFRVDESVLVRAECRDDEARARFEASPRIRVRGRDEEWQLTMLTRADTSPTGEGGSLRRRDGGSDESGLDRPQVGRKSSRRGRGTAQRLARPNARG